MLREWRFGQTQAERLCAGVLSIEGFAAVDPQHPLGGRDGLKDVLCRRGLTQFVAAAYFPTTKPTFSQIRSKFVGDLGGVKENDARGFVFFINQTLTVGERQILKKLAEAKADSTELYHLERLRSVLDAPRGCGLRLEYLRIPMTHEEQIAYWSSANLDIEAKLDRLEALQLETLQRVDASENDVIRRTSAMFLDLRSDLSSILKDPALAGEAWGSGPATSSLDLPVLLWMHRLLLSQSSLPSALVGNLRTISVSVEPADGSTPPFTPPAAEEIPGLMSTWCEGWRRGYAVLQAQAPDKRLTGIAKAYYDFLCIHPFTDGNGRMARALLDQMLRELLQTGLPQSFAEARVEHEEALQKADGGDLVPLCELISAALS